VTAMCNLLHNLQLVEGSQYLVKLEEEDEDQKFKKMFLDNWFVV